MNKVLERFKVWATIKQLREVPITLILLAIFAAMFQYSDIIERFVGASAYDSDSISETYELKIPILSILITKVASFLTIYAWVRIFIWIGFKNIHIALEELFNGEFKKLEIWQRVLISTIFLFGLLYAVLLSTPTGF